MVRQPAVHIQSQTYPLRALCGASWRGLRGGVERTTGFDPPVVRDEQGSANAVTCRTCLAVWRRVQARRR